MSQREFCWTGEDRQAQALALRMRAANPLRGSPRRKPRDPEAFEALVRLTLRLVREDTRFERLGPRTWRLRAGSDPGGVRPLR